MKTVSLEIDILRQVEWNVEKFDIRFGVFDFEHLRRMSTGQNLDRLDASLGWADKLATIVYRTCHDFRTQRIFYVIASGYSHRKRIIMTVVHYNIRTEWERLIDRYGVDIIVTLATRVVR